MNNKSLMQSIEKCKTWFIDSGIQESDKENFNFGGIYSWYDSDKDEFPFVYSEITGYGISCFLFMHDFLNDDIFLQKAENAAQWLISKASKSGAFRCKYYLKEKKFLDHLCSFDGSMILAGFCSLFEKTQKPDYKKAAIALGDWLVGKMQKSDGSFYPKLDLNTKEFIDNNEKWSTQSGSFHGKHSIGLLKLYKITKDVKYKDSVIRLCDWCLDQQKEDGRFVTNLRDNSTNLHPHCYTIEGLIFAAKFLDNEKYLYASKKALDWAMSSQLENGGFASIFKEKFLSLERMDILAQMIRLAVLLGEKEKIKISVERLEKFQIKEGGFKYGFLEDGSEVNHVNSWVSMFAIQAMIYYYNNLKGKNNSMEFFI